MAGLVLDTPAKHIYTGDGTTRVYPIPTYIQGDDWIRIEIDGIYIVDRRSYDIVNNSIIFVTAPGLNTQVSVQVATSVEALSQLGNSTNVDTVAGSIGNVNAVATNINNIDTVAGSIGNVNTTATNINNVNIVANDMNNVNTTATNINNVNTTASSIVNVNTVAVNISKVNTVATNIVDINQIVDNLPEILLADDNAITATQQATIATTKASEASASANQALTSRNQAETFKNSASTSATTAITKASEASASASSANTSASSANTSANAASISASQALISRNQAEAFADSLNIDLLVQKSYVDSLVLSVPTSYHLLQGNLAVDNTVITQGFNTTLYTGNGSTQSINTGIDMDTQWGDTAEEKFGGLVWLKQRSATNSNMLFDTVRGNTKNVRTDSTMAEETRTNLSSFNNNGFTLGVDNITNISLSTYASWNFQTTHRISGVTNHGKAYTCHYNPYTGFTIVKYEGSGIAGHEIPHHLGRKLEFVQLKNLVTNSTAGNWDGGYIITKTRLFFNTTSADSGIQVDSTDNSIIVSGNPGLNDTTNNCSYILYGWANSYFDESNILIGNYEIGVYQGTGVAGNKVKTRGKPAWVMIKRLDAAYRWIIYDNKRGFASNKRLSPNESALESDDSGTSISVVNDGILIGIDNLQINASGGQYLYMVAYDTNSDGGGSYYPKTSDTAHVQINNALIPIAKGSDINGLKNVMLSKNETITGLTYTAGKNYIYYDGNGNKGVKAYEPRYTKSELVRRFAGEQPDYYDVENNKWFNCDAGSELIVNGTFSDGTTTGWTANTLTLSIVNNTLSVVRTSDTGGRYFYQDISTEIGKKYKIKANISPSTNTAFINTYVSDTSFSNDTLLQSNLFNVDTEFTAKFSLTRIRFFISAATLPATAYFDNISVFPIDIIPTTEIPEGRNYLNHIVHADNDGGVLYVEELPKIEYKDVIKANEYQGKNACTAWVNFDGTTTPPTIRDSYNVSKVIRTGTGDFTIYFKEPMSNNTYSTIESSSASGVGMIAASEVPISYKYLDKFRIIFANSSGGAISANNADLQIFGGKNA